MNTKISYCDETWNPLAGCFPCSPGCLNCYASKAACGRWLKEHPLYKGLAVNSKWTGEIRTCIDINRPDILDKPLHWREPRTIFVQNMGDLFHPSVPFEFIDKVIFTIYKSQRHTHLILTKRIKEMLEYFSGDIDTRILNLFRKTDPKCTSGHRLTSSIVNLPHVYIGTTICTQPEADKNGPHLLQIPAAHRWLSIEPMLEEIEFKNIPISSEKVERVCREKYNEAQIRDILTLHPDGKLYIPDGTFPGIDWVVVGCESGPNRRPCKLEWIESIVDQCDTAGVKCHVKQINVGGKVIKDMNDPRWPVKFRRDEI